MMGALRAEARQEAVRADHARVGQPIVKAAVGVVERGGEQAEAGRQRR